MPVSAEQCQQVLDWMHRNGPITQEVCKEQLGIARLAARIFDLKQQGCVISDRMVTVRNRFFKLCRVKEYSLVSQARVVPASTGAGVPPAGPPLVESPAPGSLFPMGSVQRMP